MPQLDTAASLQSCAMRIARCAADGSTPAGAANGYITKNYAKLVVTPSYEAGMEFAERNACGDLALVFRDRDVMKRYDLQLDLIVPDPEIEELLIGASLLTGVPGQRSVVDGATTTGSAVVTSATANFGSGDVGKRITASAGIPVGTTIASVQSPTQATLSANATATGSGVTLNINPSVTVADGATTSASTTVTSATAAFTAGDVGKTITGAGIPVGATIVSVTNATTVVISAAATATGSGVSITIAPAAQTVGAESIPLGTVPTDNGVTMEVWTKAVVGGTQAAVNPWFHWAFARTFWSMAPRNFENAPMTTTFNGFVVENPAFGNGPWNDYRAPAPSPFSLSRAIGRFRSNDLPTPATGYVAVPAQV